MKRAMKVMLTVDEAWEWTLKMWAHIVKGMKDCTRADVLDLKKEWLGGKGLMDVRHNCLFCEYAGQKRGRRDVFVNQPKTCKHCPGKVIAWCWRHLWGHVRRGWSVGI